MEFKQRLLIAARAVRQYLDYSDKGFIPIRQEDASLKIPLSDLEGSLQSYEVFELSEQAGEALLFSGKRKIRVIYKGQRDQSALLAERGPFVLIMSPYDQGVWYNVYFPLLEPSNVYVIQT